ncbi:MAG: hypothetical protein D6731_07615 [Planctomycetota bacterium]|nr:MAG: hypothetical protein D6731_07615 [Planctomycetota bacterium]
MSLALRLPLLASVLLGCGLWVVGCEVYEISRQGGQTTVRHVNAEPDFEKTPEGALVKEAQEKDDARSWWRLGDFYERRRRWRDAIAAYERMQERIQAEEKKTGKTYVGGLYLLAKCHAVLRDWRPAVAYLQAILAKQPKTLQAAYATPTFREAHYLLGAIYFEHRMYEDARSHLIAYQELSGGDPEHRADPMLIKIEEAIGPPPATTSAPAAAPKQGSSSARPTSSSEAGGKVPPSETSPTEAKGAQGGAAPRATNEPSRAEGSD